MNGIDPTEFQRMQRPFTIDHRILVRPLANDISHPVQGQESATKPARVEPRIMRVLVLLATRQGQVVTRQELIDTIWPNRFVGEEALTVAVSRLRRMLGDRAKAPEIIETIPKVGYRMIAQIAWHSDDIQLNPAGTRASRNTRFSLWAVAAVLLLGFGLAHPPESGQILAEIRPLTTGPGIELYPDLSPDGQWVAYSMRESGEAAFDVYVRSMTVDSTWRLTEDAADAMVPCWSHDGTRIAYLTLHDGYCHVAIAQVATRRSEVLHRCGDESLPDLAWSPDDKWLVVTDRCTPADPYRIQLVNLDDGSVRSLTTPPATHYGDRAPTFSPDGKTLAFLRMTDERHGDIYTMDWQADYVRPRLESAGHPWIHDLDWSGDGELVFVGSWNDRHGIWRKRLGEGPPTWLGGRDAWQVATDPKRDRIIYVEAEQLVQLRAQAVHAADTEDAEPQRLYDIGFSQYCPAVAPDGKSLAFVSQYQGGLQLWVDREGEQTPEPLTRHVAGVVNHPAWSANGEWLIYELDLDGSSALYRIRAGGGTPQMVLGDESDNRLPIYVDAENICFVSDRSGSFQAWKLNLVTDELTLMTTRGALCVQVAPNGAIYHTRPGERGLWRIYDPNDEPVAVLKCVSREDHAHWRLGSGGVYFLRRRPDGSPRLMHYAFDSESMVSLGTLTGAGQPGTSEFAVTADGSWLCYSAVGRQKLDLVLARL